MAIAEFFKTALLCSVVFVVSFVVSAFIYYALSKGKFFNIVDLTGESSL